MAICVIVLLVAAFYGLLRYRQICRQKSRRMWLANAGLSLAMLLAAVTAGELGFACFADFSDTFNITNVSKRWLALHIDSERNNEGFRDRNPFTKYVSPGQKRIVFLGDSFTAGHGIKKIDDRFTDRIAAWLEEKRPGKYVVANLGEPGYEASMIEGLARALLFTQRADVSLIVYVYNINDIEGYDPRTQDSLRQIYTAEPHNPLLSRHVPAQLALFPVRPVPVCEGDLLLFESGRIVSVAGRGRGCGPSWPSFIASVPKRMLIFGWCSFPSCRIWGPIIRSARPTRSSSNSASRRRFPCSTWSPSSASTRAKV